MTTTTIRKAGVIGWPIHHSRSPVIHGYWLKQYGIDGTYDAIAISPDEVSSFLKNFREKGLQGANVTIPHKETLIPYLDEIDNSAQKIGAVNTIWLKDNKLLGMNTDWIGFAANLDDHVPDWSKNNNCALVLGAGGAARGVLFALIDRGFKEIYLANRTYERALSLKDVFGEQIKPIQWSEIGSVLLKANLIVNTTSLGMEGQPPLEIDLVDVDEKTLVTDIVYSPLVTPLIAKAKARGLTTVDGLGMLLHQAAPGFEKWFGVFPKVDETLRQMVIKDMGL